jgi:hypothetical protein
MRTIEQSMITHENQCTPLKFNEFGVSVSRGERFASHRWSFFTGADIGGLKKLDDFRYSVKKPLTINENISKQ